MMQCQECSNDFIRKPNTRGKFCSIKCAGINTAKSKSMQHQIMYNLRPKICKQCSSPICYKQRKENIFCSSTCSGVYTNKNRTDESRQRQQKSLINTLSQKPKNKSNLKVKRGLKFGPPTPKVPIGTIYPYTVVFLCICAKTKLKFYSPHWKKYSTDAIKMDRTLYRQASNFKFSIYHYPDMEGYQLLKEYGVYHPVTNSTGVSRDHMLSVADGWKQQIDPVLLSHPANCKLVLHTDNQRKHTSSLITLAELYDKIEVFEFLFGIEPK